MKSFYEAQMAAICHVNGPMLVLAGPGSGKTTVITYRVRQLIEEQGIPGEKILVITFTKAAADEMKTRFLELLPEGTDVNFGTFHSIFFWILKCAYHYRFTDIIAEQDKYRLIRDFIQEGQMHYDGQEDFAKNILAEISYVKGEMEDIENYHCKCMKDEDFRLIYEQYDAALRKQNKIDFDDMLVFCYELLNSRADILALWQNQFQHILIDEFQDINRIQYEIVKLLAGDRKNLFVVGDDDQSVYSFRGAKPELMLGFSDDFPNTEIVKLNINYRCSKDIVEAAQRVIRNNKKRFDKALVSAFDGEKRERVHVVSVENLREEYADICIQILSMNQKGIPFGQIAVLYRTNTEPRGLALKLMEANIPFRMRDSVPNVFQHFVVENLMDYLHLALGDRSRKRVLKIINKPNRYISRDVLQQNRVDFEMLREEYKDQPQILNRINVLENDLNRLARLTPYAAINYVRKAIGYDGYIQAYAEYRGIDKQDYLDMLEEVQDMAKDFRTFGDWFQYISEYTERIREKDRQIQRNEDAVILSTMHSAKGLEFDQVFILNAVEGAVPHKKSLKEGEIEEERRMFYVAVTRARYGLYIYVPNAMYGKPAKISRFVTEMVIDRDVLKEGNKIIHKRYGKGVITFVDDKKICVHFEKLQAVRTLSIEYTMRHGLISMSELH